VSEPAIDWTKLLSETGLYFFDTSALVKRYHTESGTPIVNRIFDDSHRYVYISSFTSLEVVSALDRKKEEGVLSQDDLTITLEGFWADLKSERTAIIEIHDSHLKLAKNLILAHHLRPADALILSQSLILKGWPADESFFVCSDKKLLSAAEALGHRVLNPDLAS
jgi:predicted nucleic acid-binding protein